VTSRRSTTCSGRRTTRGRWIGFLAAPPEVRPLPSPAALVATWEAEWAGWDAWLGTLDDNALLKTYDDVPMWQLLAHVMNHGTQHRSEAAALLTEAGRSPGDLDMMDYAEALAQSGKAAG
jgi:hypothetical protein